MESRSEITSTYTVSSARYYALGVLTVVYSFNFIDRQLLAILQEPIKADLGLTDTQLGLLTGLAFALFYAVAGVPIAKLADNTNRRNIVALAIFAWSFMTGLCGIVQNFVQLFLARVGVAVGEAGGSPPSHSMISDIFPPEHRATALGFYSTGVYFGILFGFLLGGWLNEFFGWRVAFVVVGAPGIAIAILVRLTLEEPIRGFSENRTASPNSASIRQVIAVLWGARTFRHLALAGSLTAFAGYSTSSWSASYFIRSFGMGTGEVGSWLALIHGMGGALGVFGGGLVADRLSKRDIRWYVWLPAVTAIIGTPFTAAVYLADSASMAFIFAVVPGLVASVYLGNIIAMTHALVGLKMRALASAILFLVLNLLGLGAGPWVIGAISDYYAATMGLESLRHALLCVIPIVMMWSAIHFFLASRTLARDIAAAPA